MPSTDEMWTIDLTLGKRDDVSLSDGTLTLSEASATGYPRRGRWVSERMPIGHFFELLPSWNASCPPNTGIRVYARTWDDYTKRVSPWLDYGYWGRVPLPEHGERFEHGAVAVDILELDRPAIAAQVRVDFFGFDVEGPGPTLETLHFASRGPADRNEPPDRPTSPINLDVPFIAQRTAGDRIGGEICSPTSVTMVAAFHGIEPTLVENALAIYDVEHNLFGNWNRAVQRAAELGLAGHLERFSQWAQVEPHLHAGRPIVASINFEPGQCQSFVMDETDGHLIVVRGITEGGNIIVNDGASADDGAGAIYNADELRTAWFENAGGVGYVIYPRDALP
ncbi:MAG: C39 family peptidase [Planctomycetota bacterium]